MRRNIPTDSRLASAFATLVCTWAVALVVLGLATAPNAGGRATSSPAAVAAIR